MQVWLAAQRLDMREKLPAKMQRRRLAVDCRAGIPGTRFRAVIGMGFDQCARTSTIRQAARTANRSGRPAALVPRPEAVRRVCGRICHSLQFAPTAAIQLCGHKRRTCRSGCRWMFGHTKRARCHWAHRSASKRPIPTIRKFPTL